VPYMEPSACEVTQPDEVLQRPCPARRLGNEDARCGDGGLILAIFDQFYRRCVNIVSAKRAFEAMDSAHSLRIAGASGTVQPIHAEHGQDPASLPGSWPITNAAGKSSTTCS